eukprot:6180411-Pleurochrysis_carterae.AAC.1
MATARTIVSAYAINQKSSINPQHCPKEQAPIFMASLGSPGCRVHAHEHVCACARACASVRALRACAPAAPARRRPPRAARTRACPIQR